MTAFFICIIIIGISMMAIALIWMAADKKNMHDYRIDLDGRKSDLLNVIEDSEELIDEMNRFSDYIVTKIETKQSELKSVVCDIETRVSNMSKLLEEIEEKIILKRSETINSSSGAVYRASNIPMFIEKKSDDVEAEDKSDNQSADVVIDVPFASISAGKAQTELLFHKKDNQKKGKVISLNDKRREVLSLQGEGYNHAQIAKMLDMGCGEIELIAKLCR